MVICLERGADLHMAQLMPLPLTFSCSSKIQIGFSFLVPAYPGCPGKEAVKWLLLLYDSIMCVSSCIKEVEFFLFLFLPIWQLVTKLHCLCMLHNVQKNLHTELWALEIALLSLTQMNLGKPIASSVSPFICSGPVCQVRTDSLSFQVRGSLHFCQCRVYNTCSTVI